jgi:hypothetical protein
MVRTKVIRIDQERFEELRDNGYLKSYVAYEVRIDNGYWKEPTTQWAWSPDGIGCFWYETVHELMYEHGTERDWEEWGCTPAGYAEWQVTLEQRRA